MMYEHKILGLFDPLPCSTQIHATSLISPLPMRTYFMAPPDAYAPLDVTTYICIMICYNNLALT